MTDPAAPAEHSPTRPFDLRDAFRAKQNALNAALAVTVGFTDHGTTIGDASEANWAGCSPSSCPAGTA